MSACHHYNPPGVCRRVEHGAEGHPLPLALTLGQPCARAKLMIHPRMFRVAYLECAHRFDESSALFAAPCLRRLSSLRCKSC